MSKSSSCSGKGFGASKLRKTKKLRVFALEPILTPSGLVDTLDDAPDPGAVEIPDYVGDLSQPTDQQLLPANDGQDIEDLDTGDETWTSITSDSDPDLESATPDLDSNWEEVPFVSSYEPLSSVFESGVFVVGDSGEVSVDFLFDGGGYQGELAFFSLEGMEAFEPGSEAFIQEAASRAMSESELGHVVISDPAEGARFSGILGNSDGQDYNTGDYQGVKTFTMRPGDEFGVMLVPNGRVAELLDNPALEGSKRPLFSMATANPDDAFQVGQIVDVTGDGNTFVFEDLRVDQHSDKDYNDTIFQVRGAFGRATLMDEVMPDAKDWRDTDLGQALVNYAKPYIEAQILEPLPEPIVVDPSQQPLIGIIDTGFSGDNLDIDYTNVTLGSDRVDGDDNPLLAPSEGNEHGTHILGIIAAKQDNGIGIDGINDDAPIWLGRGVGAGTWAESLVEFVDAARDSNQPNAVVNLSMDLTQIDADGNLSTRYEFTPLEMAALEYARQNNIIVAVAAGNDGGVMSALGQASQQFDNIITVGSAEQFDSDTSVAKGFSRSDYSSYGYGLDIVAEGGTPEQPALSTVGDSTDSMYGTSVATARVTGGISQVWAANPQLSYRQVIDILKSTATDLNAPNVDLETGTGLINIAAAIHLARVADPEEYTPELQVVPTTWSGEGMVTPLERAAHYPYELISGDTLWRIAQERLGDANRWTEITRDEAGNIPFTEAEARFLPIGLTVYIPGDNPIATPVQDNPSDSNPSQEQTFASFASAFALPQSLQSASWLDFIGRMFDRVQQNPRIILATAPSENIVIRPGNTTLNFLQGQEWTTANNHKFVFQNDGNLVLYNPQGQPTWATGTNGSNANRLAVQADGNVVLYDNSRPVWATNTHGNSGAYLRIQSDGNVVVYSSNGSPLFDTGTHSGRRGVFNASSIWLNQPVIIGASDFGSGFRRGEEWVTRLGHRLAFQLDGNLVLYDPQGQAVWATGTHKTTADRFSVQPDGNVVLYNQGKPVWASNTSGNPGAYLAVQPDGNLVVYSSSGVPLFNTETHSGQQGVFNASSIWLNQPVIIGASDFGSGFGRGEEWVTRLGHRLAFQLDGNLVLYDPQGRPMWATGTHGTTADRFSVQPDGNVVLYNQGKPVWASNTAGNPGAYLAIQPDGNLVVYSPSGVPLFNTRTHSGQQGTLNASAEWLNPPPIEPFPLLDASDFVSNWRGWPEYTSRNPFPGKGANCTWYAHGRMMQLGYSELALDSMMGNAEDWDDTASNGATVVNSPQIPSIAVWEEGVGEAGSLGHVAVVERINTDGSIFISESNWPEGTTYNTRTIYPGTDRWPSKFITVPKA